MAYLNHLKFRSEFQFLLEFNDPRTRIRMNGGKNSSHHDTITTSCDNKKNRSSRKRLCYNTNLLTVVALRHPDNRFSNNSRATGNFTGIFTSHESQSKTILMKFRASILNRNITDSLCCVSFRFSIIMRMYIMRILFYWKCLWIHRKI